VSMVTNSRFAGAGRSGGRGEGDSQQHRGAHRPQFGRPGQLPRAASAPGRSPTRRRGTGAPGRGARRLRIRPRGAATPADGAGPLAAPAPASPRPQRAVPRGRARGPRARGPTRAPETSREPRLPPRATRKDGRAPRTSRRARAEPRRPRRAAARARRSFRRCALGAARLRPVRRPPGCRELARQRLGDQHSACQRAAAGDERPRERHARHEVGAALRHGAPQPRWPGQPPERPQQVAAPRPHVGSLGSSSRKRSKASAASASSPA
jgi:hypothetical protein